MKNQILHNLSIIFENLGYEEPMLAAQKTFIAFRERELLTEEGEVITENMI